ncbi:MAG: ATP-dependent helicase HrpB [Pseudomonadota bacterium]
MTSGSATDRAPLPVDAVLPALAAEMAAAPITLLSAPPGAGKTTRVPPFLLEQAFLSGKSIIIVEPRRLAARAAAMRMAEERGEEVGATIGFRVRLETCVSDRTRIEVVTDGVFRRLVLNDPELSGIGAVVFDEFHERSLDADFGLALARDVQAGLREDLKLLIMSATLESRDLSARLDDAPIVESAGRLHPIDTEYRPAPTTVAPEDHLCRALMDVLDREPGDILCFLPGQAEIARITERLADRLPANVRLHPLLGSLTRAEQDAALRAASPGTRKVVLATAVAETSLTIEGVRIVFDTGFARVPRFDPGNGMTRLETVRAPRSSVDQRRGRAGRTGPGLCVRLWPEGQTGALPARPDPEILQADLSPLVLDMASFGVTDPDGLPFLDPPPSAAWKGAVTFLNVIGALDDNGTLTAAGRAMGSFPLHPRLAHMVVRAHAQGLPVGTAADIAAIMSERGLGGRSLDLRQRLRTFRAMRSKPARALRRQADQWAKRVQKGEAVPERDEEAAGILLAFAYPDRIAQSRETPGSFKLSNGTGCRMDAAEVLAGEPYLAVAETIGPASSARVLLAAPISREDLERHVPDWIVDQTRVEFDSERLAVRTEQRKCLGALVLNRKSANAKPGSATRARLFRAIVERGFGVLGFDPGIDRLCARIEFLRSAGEEACPDITEAMLLGSMDRWLDPFVPDAVALSDLTRDRFTAALAQALEPRFAERLRVAAPEALTLAGGRDVSIDYLRDGGPGIDAKPHEVFGPQSHPAILDGRYPLAVTLLSPAGRPIQVTSDLHGFWSGSWRQVRAELRSRYPKHFWPEHPGEERPRASSIKART